MSNDGMWSEYDPSRPERRLRWKRVAMSAVPVLGVCWILYLLLDPPEVRMDADNRQECDSVMASKDSAQIAWNETAADPGLVLCQGAALQRLGWSVLLAVPTTILGVTVAFRWPRKER